MDRNLKATQELPFNRAKNVEIIEKNKEKEEINLDEEKKHKLM